MTTHVGYPEAIFWQINFIPYTRTLLYILYIRVVFFPRVVLIFVFLKNEKVLYIEIYNKIIAIITTRFCLKSKRFTIYVMI
jgi:hypothetical protein